MTQTKTTEMDPVQSVANAVMYEGYLLYPYRPSALKNRQRWNFGVLFPPAYCERAQSGDSSLMQTECLADAAENGSLEVKVRFLQLVGDQTMEREVACGSWSLHQLAGSPQHVPVCFQRIEGTVEISAERVAETVFKCTVRITNTSACEVTNREEALHASLISVHSFLRVERGAFISMIDVPAALAVARQHCDNIGAWPVLIGPEGDRSQMLASPIILYDYPKLAPQSQRDLFDGTEIDEILSLRIQTLTEEEKRELGEGAVTAALLEDVDGLNTEELRRMHGVFYREGTQRASFKPGDRVTIHPKRRADIFDIALTGRAATVCSVEKDFENQEYVCVTIDDDPGQDLGREGKPGHRFFFGLDEVQRI